jgi:hypothetical protein
MKTGSKGLQWNVINKMALLNKAVDFRSRRFAFRGAGAEPPRRLAPAGSHLTS